MLEALLRSRSKYRSLLDAQSEKIQRKEEIKYHEKLLEVTRELRDEYETEIDNRDSEIHGLMREIERRDRQIKEIENLRVNSIRQTKRNRKLAADMLVEVRRILERDAEVLKAFSEINDMAQRNEHYLTQNKLEVKP